MNTRFKTRIHTLVLLLAVLACILASGCKGPGGVKTAGVVASATFGPVGEKPATLIRYDGNTFVAWSSVEYVAELYIQATGMPLLIYAGKESTAIVKVNDPPFQWEGKFGDPLPSQAASQFRGAEIEAWNLFLPSP